MHTYRVKKNILGKILRWWWGVYMFGAPSCSVPVSHAGGPHIASFVVGRPCACVRACARASVAQRAAGACVLVCGRSAMRCKQEGKTADREEGENPEEEKGAVRAARPPQAVGTACEILHEREKRCVRAVVVQRGPRGAGAARVALRAQQH